MAIVQLSEVDQEDAPLEEILEPELPIVDAHHHLWPPGYWIPYDSAVMQTDLGRGHNVVQTVFVECMTSFRPDGDEALRPVGETEFVVRACPTGTTIGTTYVGAGIVGWADLAHPDSVGQHPRRPPRGGRRPVPRHPLQRRVPRAPHHGSTAGTRALPPR